MDFLPAIVAHDLSDSSDSAEEAAESSELSRLSVPVGHCVSLPSFTGTCLGDSVAWKGSAVTRFAAVQSGGGGGAIGICGAVTGVSLCRP